jgi:flagellar hook protein FlgE
MFSSFFSGISGLMANSYSISVVGNNISNVNTIGYKAARASFEDALYESIFGTAGTSQIGRGTALSSVDTLFAQGSFESTSEPTDLAIGGKGFFVVRPSEDGNDQLFYTRAGQFRFDKDGYMINPAGYRLQGRVWDTANDQPVGPPAGVDIQVKQQDADPEPSTFIGMALNLSSTAANTAYDPALPRDRQTPSYTSSINVFDLRGGDHTVDVEFYHTGDDTWEWRAFDATTDLQVGQGDLAFNPDGTLDTTVPSGGSLACTFNNVAQSIEIFFDADIRNGNSSTTQNAGVSTVNIQTANGYPPGTLMNVTVSPAGIVEGRYSNGQIIALYQIDLANFNNPWGLSREGGNLFAETLDSGSALIDVPGTSGLGKVSPNSLEQSNVDLATEFVKMIIAQRGFQANSKVITTTDEMLADLMMIKR